MANIEESFAALDLPIDSSAEEIKQAFRDLSQVWHPDKYSHNPRLRAKAEERFKRINEAYQLLSSRKKPDPTSARGNPEENVQKEKNTGHSRSQSCSPPQIKIPALWMIGVLVFFLMLYAVLSGLGTKDHPDREVTVSSQPPPPTDASRAPINTRAGIEQSKDQGAEPQTSRASLDTTQAALKKETTSPNSFASEPLIQRLPKEQQDHVTVEFTSPGPIAKGIIRNRSNWVITGGTIAIERHFKQIITDVLVVRDPEPDAKEFEVIIKEKSIEPLFPGEISVELGTYLSPYEDLRWGKPPVKFSIVKSIVQVKELRGYQKYSP